MIFRNRFLKIVGFISLCLIKYVEHGIIES